MKTSNVLMGIDIGTTKICTVIARDNGPEEPLEIIGVGLSPSHGLNKGTVVDLDITAHSIQEAARKAMNLAGVEVRRTVVGIAGEFIQSFNSLGSAAVSGPERGITEDDVHRATRTAVSKVIPKDFDVIHELHRTYRVDDSSSIVDPLGMVGCVLEVDVHLVAGRRTALRNIRNCVQQAGLQVSDIVLQPIASSLSVLSEEEKEAGVALVDLGGGTTDVAVYYDGQIQHSEVILIGGDYITKDICRAFVTPFEVAENLKCKFGTANSSLSDPEEKIDIARIAGRSSTTVKRADLAWVIEARVEQILDLVGKTLHAHKLKNKMFGGLVLTGGTALLEGIRDKTESHLKLETNLGYPAGISGYKDIITSPMYATAVGLLHYARQQRIHGSCQHRGWMRRTLGRVLDYVAAAV
jgi:cell division protein FtsA